MSDSPSPVKEALSALKELRARLDEAHQERYEPIAIVGMGCRYPGSEGIGELWRHLCDGMDAIEEAPKDRWDLEHVFDPDPAVPGKMTSRWGGFLRRIDEFDAAFFGISPREAPYVDPRQRVMAEIAWEALEDAGIPPDSLAGTRTGVFLATLTNDYDHLLFADLARAGAYSGAGTANSIVANRLSYFLNLHGPSVVIDTACSGSLVAVHLACESLRSGECTAALAGGVSINLMAKSNVFFSKAGALAADGRCKSFDARADGMVRSDGAGVLVLKRWSDAIRDGDPVAAIIRGSAINHDGRSNGIMAPNGEAQKAVLEEAYRRAGVAPADVQCVEAHGTGTRLGDPIEVEALAAVLGRGRPAGRLCALGSIKSNIGHTEAAAGVAGIIKTALALRHRHIPPTLHVRQPNPLMRFERLFFTLPREVTLWPVESERLVAGVSGFGFGGTNAHVVLEEAPRIGANRPAAAAPYILPLSARTPTALQALALRYAGRIHADTSDTADVCATAAIGRAHLPSRAAIVADSCEGLRARLEQRGAGVAQRSAPSAVAGDRPDGPVAFVFSGQGSHWPAMGIQLAAREPVFLATLEACDRALARHTGWSVIEEIGRAVPDTRLNVTHVAQPAVFAIQIALTALWRSWGITPDLIVGHSLGEAAAACASGALSLDDAAAVVFHRSRLMQRVAGQGATAVVGLPADRVAAVISSEGAPVVIAGSNSPTTTVISGDPESVRRVLDVFARQAAFCRLLPGVDIAFHSPQMDPLRHDLVRALGGLTPAVAAVPMVSTVTGQDIDGGDLDGEYWGRNLRDRFEFTRATECVLAHGCTTIVEVSPHPVLSSAIVQTARASGKVGLAVLASLRRHEPELLTMYGSLGALYEQGRRIAWDAVYSGAGRRVSLPSYPWERHRYWFDQLAGSAGEDRAPATRGTHPLLGDRVEPAVARAGDDRLSIWETDWSADEATYLTDHRVLGDVVMPGAAILEMATAACRDLWGDRAVAVTGVVFERPLRLEPGDRRRVQLTLQSRGDAAELTLHSRRLPGDGSWDPWTRYAHGQIQAANDERALETVTVQGQADVSVHQHYEMLKAVGLDYGPGFRTLVRLARGDGGAVGELRLPSNLSHRRYLIHPALIDGAFQIVATLAAGEFGYLPTGVREWTVTGSPGRGARCHARLSGVPGDETLLVDFDLFGDDGVLCARARGVELTRTVRARPVDRLADLSGSLIGLQWQPGGSPAGASLVSRAAAPTTWIVFADECGVATALVQRLERGGDRAVVVRHGLAYEQVERSQYVIRTESREDLSRMLEDAGPICGGIVHMWSLDAREPDIADADSRALEDAQTLGAISALHVTQAMASLMPTARLWLVTRGAEAVAGSAVRIAQAPLAGEALSIAGEHPELRCTMLDLDPGAPNPAEALFAELQADTSESRVAWRNDTRYVARLERVAVPEMAGDKRLRGDATYAITGGLGALGLHAADCLVAMGARRLVLIGRRAPSANASARIRELERGGAVIVVASADVSRRGDVEKLFDDVLGPMPPLRGLIHAAGVLDDGILAEQSRERFLEVMAPKILGAWNLHVLTARKELDFFVCYSSVSSLVGSPGQASYAAANRFLDALAHHRRQQGLPALSIGWGPWSGEGMAASDTVRRRFAARGVRTIEPLEASALLPILISGVSAPHVGVFPVDWSRFLSQFPGDVAPMFERVAPQPDDVTPVSVLASVTAGAAAERGAIINRHLRRELVTVFGFEAASDMPADQTFFDLGMDSLMAVELRNRLHATFDLRLTATIAFDHPTVDALGTHLLARLFPDPVRSGS